VTLREEHRLRVFENRLLRRIFEPKRDNITMGLAEIGRGVVNWIGLTYDGYKWRVLVNAAINLKAA
jgi:hypothetical protein